MFIRPVETGSWNPVDSRCRTSKGLFVDRISAGYLRFGRLGRRCDLQRSGFCWGCENACEGRCIPHWRASSVLFWLFICSERKFCWFLALKRRRICSGLRMKSELASTALHTIIALFSPNMLVNFLKWIIFFTFKWSFFCLKNWLEASQFKLSKFLNPTVMDWSARKFYFFYFQWMYIVPVVIFMVVSNAFNVDQPQQD